MKPQCFFSLIAGLVLAGSAQAQQVVASFSSEILRTTTDWTQTLQLPGFDASLGTLTQVKLSYAGEIWQSLQAENLGAGPATYDQTTTATLSLGKTAGPTLFSPAPIVFHQTGSLSGFDGTPDFAGPSGVASDLDTKTNGFILDPNLASYLSLNPISFDVSVASVTPAITGGNFLTGNKTDAAVSLSVEYTYTAIPEPSTFAVILGAGVLGFVTIRRRKVLSLD